ncbi:hypothetical protein [Rhodoplanes elegans]|uniref:hypothetical protein n=1 Tax=Rhodoplanes elegans TaxID=29408 RepID=UPI0019136351|nr:hypothetical protein [Rhodoplanes elegans]
MVGLVPAIHVCFGRDRPAEDAECSAIVDGRDEPGHDDAEFKIAGPTWHELPPQIPPPPC